MRLSPLVALLVLAACNGSSVSPLVVAIITPSGGDPLSPDAGVTHVHIDLREGTGTPIVLDEDTTSSGWSHDIRITDINAIAQTRVTLTLPTGPLIGAAPDFVPSQATTVVRLPVGPPLTCATLVGATFATPRAHPAAVLTGTFALVAGEPAASAGDSLEPMDLLALAVSSGMGATDMLTLSAVRFVPLGTSGALAVSTTTDTAETYNPFQTDPTLRQSAALSLHPGSHLGTPLSVATVGAAIVGGEVGAAAARDVTWVGVDGHVVQTSNALSVGRVSPAAVELSNHAVLVAGGSETPGVADVVPYAMPGTAVGASYDDHVRRGAALFADAGGHEVLLIGGVDASGMPRSDTVLFTGCPDACAPSVGPSWTNARTDATAVALPAGGGLLIGGRRPGPAQLVTRVSFDGSGTPSVLDSSPLASERASPAVFALPSGLVYVIEGVGADGTARNDVEICFPDQLVPL